MNKTYEQYLSSRRGLILDYRDRFSDRVIDTLSRYIPEEERDIVNGAIRNHRRQMHKLLEKDENQKRREVGYLEKMRRHFQHKEEYVAVTP